MARTKKDKLKEAGDAVLKKPRKSKKKEELKASSVVTAVDAAAKPVTVVERPPVPLQSRKIVPHLLVQEVQSLRNEVDSLKIQVQTLLTELAKK